MQATVYTVKQFNELVNTVLGQTIGEASVTGEVSGFQIRQGKFAYFDIKDGESVLNCFAMVYQLDMPLSDGLQVTVTGTPRVYVPFGKYSFTVRQVELKGEGALQKAYEQLKAKLDAEGLFSPAHKRPLPRYPETIGIITSGEGAAVNDILKVVNGRWGGLKLFLAPVLVQGKNAPDELVGAINYFNQHHPVDVIIFGRGGGSLEDLQVFNSERVARAIFSSRIPIVSGIGHEHNTSIADLVADVRAATPSNAAEIAVPDRQEVARHVSLLKHRAEQTVNQRLLAAHNAINRQRHDLQLFASSRLSQIRLLIQRVRQLTQDNERKITLHRDAIVRLRQSLDRSLLLRLERSRTMLQEHQKLLVVLNPKGILSRGYSITYQKSTGKPISRLADLPADGRIETHLSDGSFDSTVVMQAASNQPSLF